MKYIEVSMEKILKILFVEDVQSDAELIWRTIEKSDIKFDKRLVDNKKEFLEALNSFEPDMIISDYSLPQFDGMNALMLRNEINPLIPFILVTGSLNETIAVECMKAGADDYILKENLSRLGLAITNSLKKTELLKEKKAAVEELRISEQRLQKAQAIAHVGNWEIDFSKKTMWGSEEALRIYGLDTNCHEIPLKTAQDIPLHEYRSILDETLDRLLKYNEPYQIEFKIKRVNNGEIRSIYSKAELSVNEEDKKVKVIGVIQDITEQKRAEEIIIENEEIFKNFMEYSPIFIFFKDENIRAKRLSRNFEKMLGKPMDEMLGKTMNELFPSELAKKMVDDDKRILKEGKEITVEEKLNGRFYSTIKFPIIIDGKPSYLAGYTIDITDRRQSEEALKQSETRFKQISENFGEWIWEVDKDGLYTYSSPVVKDILGFEPEEIINKKYFYDLFILEERKQLMKAAMEAFERKENFRNFINVNLHKDGREVILSTSGFPLLDKEGNLIGYRGVDTDITERKSAEEALARSKKEFQNYFESGSVGMSVTLPDKSWIEVNQKLCKMFGYSKHELLGMTWIDLSHPDDRSENLELFQKSLDGKINNYEIEKRFVCKDGKLIYVTLSVVCERNPDGTVHHFLASYNDITERVLAEEKIQHERIMLRTLIDNLPDVIYVKDNNGRKLISNIADLRNSGLTREDEVYGKTDMELFPGEIGNRGYKDDIELINHGKAIVEREEDFVDVNGQKRWLLTTKVPLRDKNGLITGLVGIGHDITDRKKAEEELHQSYIINESLLKTIPFGMDIVDETGTVLFQSEHLKRIFGEGALGNKCWDLYRDDKKQCGDCPLIKGIKVGETEAYESLGVLGGRIFEISHTGMMYHGKKAMLEIFQDITDRKINEAELIAAKEKAEEGDRLKTAFLHNISHEIRTPMNAIVGFSALLSEQETDEETRKSYIETIMQSSNHLLSIITDIVDISHLEANLVKVKRVNVNINRTLDSIYNQLLPKASEKNLKLLIESKLPENETSIICDSTKITQVLINLITNAIKFTDKGNVKVGCCSQGNFLKFSVSDTGIGIPEEFHEKIFDRFFQVQNSDTRLYEGTGLGLAISKANIELMGGKIWLDSESGKGATFYFTIPYEIQLAVPVEVAEKKRDMGFSFPRKVKILVAEDIESNYKLLSYFLSGADVTVLRASNGKEAYESAIANTDIDLILMDIKMPEMDGYTATKLIRDANITIPIIAQTAYVDDREKAIQAGCDGFISKPFDRKGLIKVLGQFIK
jgi:PAS domain S-box-containing protein